MAIVTISGNSVDEGNRPWNYFEFELSLDAPATEEIIVGYRLVSGLADASVDLGIYSYDGTRATHGGTATFDVGEQSALLRLYAQYDSVEELDESFVVEAHIVQGGAQFAGGNSVARAVGFLRDDDGAPNPRTIHVDAPVMVEGDNGVKEAQFLVNLSRPAEKDYSIPWETVAGSASAGSDFKAASGILEIYEGQTEALISVEVFGDKTVEATERFSIRFDAPDDFAAVYIDDAVIMDDDSSDTLPVLTIRGTSDLEGSRPWSYMTFPVTLDKPAVNDIVVQYRIISGTASATGDVGSSTSQITIPKGATQGIITVYGQYDSTFEQDESYEVEISIASGAAVFPNGAISAKAIGFLINDDSGPAPIAIHASSANVTEGDSGRKNAVFEIELSRPAEKDFTIDYHTVGNGGATPGVDFVSVDGTFEVARGQRHFSVSVPIIGDRDIETNEKFSLILDPSISLPGITVATGTILNNDEPPFSNGDDDVDFSGESRRIVDDALAGDDRVILTRFNDNLFGNDGDDTLEGRLGNDTLRGGNDDDRLLGHAGKDLLQGDAGDDTLYGHEGNDVLEGGSGVDILDGGEGNDVLRGGAHTDIMSGDTGNDLLYGEAGNDRMLGEAGNDTLVGEAGVDEIRGGSGADSMRGGGGADVISGEAGNDYASGGSQKDVISGGSGNDRLFGDAGHDTLSGDAGADTLNGGSQHDSLVGGGGNDLLIGGSGNDILVGQGGFDRFDFQGRFGHDTLRGFSLAAQEKIDFSDVDAIKSFRDLINNHAESQGNSTLIEDGSGNSVLLVGIDIDDLARSDFIF